MEDWFLEVCQESLPVTMDLSMKKFLLDDAILRDWNYMGLPDDNFSAENGIIVVRATRWPLAVDPQGQALIWISRLEEKNDIQVVDFGQPNYMRIMETCLSTGKPILIQNVGEVLDPSIAPILEKAVVTIGNSKVIKFNDKMVSYHEDFHLYLTTKLGNPVYTPETLTKTTMVNFAVKEQGLTSQLLGIVVRKERPQLEQMKDTLVLSIAHNKKVLVDLENDLLRIMYESQVPLLENEELFITLQTSQRTSLEVKEALITSQVTEKEIDTARAGYVPVAVRASVLFFALNDLSRIDPMYQFSLDAYIDLFMYSIDRSPKAGELEDRINNLNEFHTYAVYKNTCRALFERHKLLLSFHIVSRILFQSGKMSRNEYMFLLKGGVVLDRSEQPDNPTNWMPEECWDNITELDKLPGFHGLVDVFEPLTKEWKEWYLHPEPETQPLIGDWNEICSDFQKILFIRSLRVDRVSACITTFIVNLLGPRYVEPPVLDIRAAWEESSWKTPLLFVLSPGVDPTAALIQLSQDVKMFERFQSLSLGQGQAPTATKMLSHGMKEGGWVFLANCHLACEWLGSLRGLDNPKIHPRFRLWLSSMPDNKFPLNILQRSIKMTTEPPQGLKGNLVRLFANINEDKFDEATPMYRRLLFCVSFFHCTLIARKRFRQLGYNAVYSFNDADFDVSDNLLANYLEEYEEVPWDALRYLFAIINYGGHITDDWDKRVLIAYINQFFNEEALETPFYSQLLRRSPPSTPSEPPRDPSPPPVRENELPSEVISTPEIQKWMSSIDSILNEVCIIVSEGKMNSEQKLRVTNLCRKVSSDQSSQMAILYQALKQKTIQAHNSNQHLQEQLNISNSLQQLKDAVENKIQPKTKSYANMVKKGSDTFVCPENLNSVVIYPNDKTKTSDETKSLVQKIISPEELKLHVRGLKKVRNGGVIINTETKGDIEKLKNSEKLVSSGLKIEEPSKRRPRIAVIGVPVALTEKEVFDCIFEQNITDKLPNITRESFLETIKLSHKSGKMNLSNSNYVLEVHASIRRALINQGRIFINWTSCPVRDFTIVTRCFNCQQFGHAAKFCREAIATCNHCGETGHSFKDCSNKSSPSQCATCKRFKRKCDHPTGDMSCPARKYAEDYYINSIDYEGA
ncbi:unnamed protein product [Spodoptera exigua]|nr:unnamed protein product [Spodoptera exigua]